MDLSSKVALVSGAASGLGEAHARAIVRAGGKVVMGDVNDEAGRRIAAELGDKATYVHLDVANAGDWKQAVAMAVKQYGGLNVLVNNAGVLSFGDLASYAVEEWNRVMAVNLTGAFLGVAAALDALKASAPSSIINISSVAGFRGAAGLHAYTASKFGVRGFTKSAALELAPFNIRVNSIHPGPMRTAMTAGMSDAVAKNAMKRMGRPEEIANIVVFLATDLASFCTGAEFIADGGEIAGAIYDDNEFGSEK